MQKVTIEDIEARLEKLTIFELRQTARAVGVAHAATGTKVDVRRKVIAIANGTTKPVPCENPTGTRFANEALVKDILAFRESKISK
ncbi:MAG: hypothetical protein NC489_29735 [Ruminococcus flavefaciens]|nr:hypothetical protein [Ruminococcus flavefaciens]